MCATRAKHSPKKKEYYKGKETKAKKKGGYKGKEVKAKKK